MIRQRSPKQSSGIQRWWITRRFELLVATVVSLFTCTGASLFYGRALGWGLLSLGVTAAAFRWWRRKLPKPRRGAVGAILATAAVVGIGIVASVALDPFSPLAWILGAYALLVLVGGRAFAIALALSPVVFHVGEGAHAYWSGRPTLRTIGMVREVRLDPFTRAPVVSRGCIVRGGEWLPDGSYNLGVAGMTWLFGRSPNVYRGPMVNTYGLQAALDQHGRFISTEALLDDRVNVGARPFRLTAGTGRLLDASAQPLGPRVSPSVVRTVTIGDRIVALEWLRDHSTLGRFIVAFDRRTGFAIADTPGILGEPVLPLFVRYGVVALERERDGFVGTVIGHPSCRGRGVDRWAAMNDLRRRATDCHALGIDRFVPLPSPAD